MPKRNHTACLHQRLRQEPRYAAECRSAVLEDSNETFLAVLRDVTEARTMTARIVGFGLKLRVESRLAGQSSVESAKLLKNGSLKGCGPFRPAPTFVKEL